jgi:hypothetical protein
MRGTSPPTHAPAGSRLPAAHLLLRRPRLPQTPPPPPPPPPPRAPALLPLFSRPHLRRWPGPPIPGACTFLRRHTGHRRPRPRCLPRRGPRHAGSSSPAAPACPHPLPNRRPRCHHRRRHAMCYAAAAPRPQMARRGHAAPPCRRLRAPRATPPPATAPRQASCPCRQRGRRGGRLAPAPDMARPRGAGLR